MTDAEKWTMDNFDEKLISSPIPASPSVVVPQSVAAIGCKEDSSEIDVGRRKAAIAFICYGCDLGGFLNRKPK